MMRPDLYEEAMKEIGYEHGGPNSEPETLFDGVVVRSGQAGRIRQVVRRSQHERLSCYAVDGWHFQTNA